MTIRPAAVTVAMPIPAGTWHRRQSVTHCLMATLPFQQMAPPAAPAINSPSPVLAITMNRIRVPWPLKGSK